MPNSTWFMRDVSLTLKLTSGTRVEFNCQLTVAEVLVTPGDEVTRSTLCIGGSFTEIGKPSYALHIVAGQAWDTTGLARFLWDNEGLTAECQYQMHGEAAAASATIPGITGTVRLVAPTYGGEVDTYAELDVTMPFTAKPTLAVAVFPAMAMAEGETEEATAAA